MKSLHAVHFHPTERSGIVELSLDFIEQEHTLIKPKDWERFGVQVQSLKCVLGKNDPADCVARQLRNIADAIDPKAE